MTLAMEERCSKCFDGEEFAPMFKDLKQRLGYKNRKDSIGYRRIFEVEGKLKPEERICANCWWRL